MNSNFKLVFLLPTCEPDEMLAWLQPTLHRLDGLQDMIAFAICFQPPYTSDQIKLVLSTLDRYKIEYKYFIKDYEVVPPYTPLIKMRNDCALLYPEADAYTLLDDDMSFEKNSIVEVFKKVIHKFEQDPELSVIALNDYQRQYENIFATNGGLVYRGGKYYGFKGLVPQYLSDFKGYQTTVPYEGENLLELFGGFQDKFCAMIRLCAKHKASQIWNVPVKHVENRKVRGAAGHGWDNAKYQKGSIAQFIIKYFNKYFLLTMSMTLFEPNLMTKICPNYWENDASNIVDYKY